MGDEYQSYVLKPEADLTQLPLHGGEGLVGVPAGVNQHPALVSLDEVGVDGQLVELEGKGQLQLMYAREDLHGYLPRLKKALCPGKRPSEPISCSIRRRRLYLQVLSERQGAPVLIRPVFMATARSAMVVSSVSPERWLTTAVQLTCLALRMTLMASVRVPTWFGFIRTELEAWLVMPRSRRLMLVAYKSSPTSCTFWPSLSRRECHPCQSSSAMPSSMLMMGKLAAHSA